MITEYRSILAAYGPEARDNFAYFCPGMQLVLVSNGSPADYMPVRGSTRFMHNGVNPPVNRPTLR